MQGHSAGRLEPRSHANPQAVAGDGQFADNAVRARRQFLDQRPLGQRNFRTAPGSDLPPPITTDTGPIDWP